MKVSVLQEKLSQGLSSVLRVVSGKPTLPILNNILLRARKGELELFATDLNLGIRLTVGAKVQKEGSITVPAKVFGELVSSLPASTVDLKLEGEILHIASNNYKVQLSGTSAKEFPILGDFSRKLNFSLDSKQFQSIVDKVVISASSDETRPVLSGVLLTYLEKKLQLVATDGYRLSVASIIEPKKKNIVKWRKSVQETMGDGIILPSRVLKDVARLVDELKVSKISATVNEKRNLMAFVLGDCEVTSRLIDGTFPNFSKVIPNSSESEMIVDLEALVQATRTSAIFARDSANIVYWKIKDNKLEISCRAAVGGEGSYDGR